MPSDAKIKRNRQKRSTTHAKELAARKQGKHSDSELRGDGELNPDVVQSDLDPATHYVTQGISERREYVKRPISRSVRKLPDDFDPAVYLELNPDVVQSDLDPATHYVTQGISERREYVKRPTSRSVRKLPDDFDPAVYLELNPDVAQSDLDPATHYVTQGISERREYVKRPISRSVRKLPDDFDPAVYLELNPDVVQSDLDPATHYVTQGISERREYVKRPTSRSVRKLPDDFDPAVYLELNPDVAQSDLDPATHYVTQGIAERREYVKRPTSRSVRKLPDDFDPAVYLELNPDVVQSDLDPATHYVTQGIAERREYVKQFDRTVNLESYGQQPTWTNILVHDVKIVFDTIWYLAQNPDVAQAGINPLVHFLSSGAAEGRDPSPLFDTDWYLAQNPDVAQAGINPLVHFLSSGAAEGRDPSPLFDTDWYLAQNPDVAQAGINPLKHFLSSGAAEGRDPSPLFDTDWYLAQNPDVAQAGINPLVHFLSSGAAEGRDPSPLFDTDWYLAQNPDVAQAGINPLKHFLSSGAAEGRDPSPLFDTDWYLAQNPDVAQAGINPLVHFLTTDAVKGRDPSPLFDTDWYLALYPEVALAKLNPLVHYVKHGVASGYDPSPLFDTDWYLARNPDVAQSGTNPLAHFLSSGAAEGRQPFPPDHRTPDCRVLDIPYEVWRVPPSLVGRDVCLFVTYSANGHIYDHVQTYLRALKVAGLLVVLVIATDGLNQSLSLAIETADGILLRRNHGWDFAAWAAGLTAFPDLWAANLLILANDSVYGPIETKTLTAVINRIRASKCDLVALTDSYQVRYHLMSYFTGLTRSGLASPLVRNFWNKVRSINDKQEIINLYELTSVDRLKNGGIEFEVIFPTTNDKIEPVNPTLERWRDLIARGFPFLKVQVLRDKLPQCDPSGWRDVLEKNPDLVDQIAKHINDINSQQNNKRSFIRPIPAPYKRFSYNFDLQTCYGATPACRLTELTDLALEVPFRWLAQDISSVGPVAVVVHIFYPELSDELLARIQNIPVRADLFISTDSASKKLLIETVFSKYNNGSVEIKVFPNVGRDIAPAIVGYSKVFNNYNIFLHIHSKKSIHSNSLFGWREFLFDNLLGSPEIVRSILALFAATDVGIVFSQHFSPVKGLINFGGNYEVMQNLLAEANVSLSKDMLLEFPSSSFFWGRSAAIRPILNRHLTWSDFELENQQVDGTIAHAIERVILFCAESCGFRWAKVARDDNVRSDTLVPIHGPGLIAEAVTRVHFPLIGNRLRAPDGAHLINEVREVRTRRDDRPRARLNLIIPTLQEEKIFGGITTALGVFRALATKIGDDFDYRIISLSDSVDMASMRLFPDYRLLPLGSVKDEITRAIIDASEPLNGELPVRAHDIFMATAWWTATTAFSFQKNQNLYHKKTQPVVYLIQDHEPDFYGLSSQRMIAQETYAGDKEKISLINSEELAEFLTSRYSFGETYVIPFQINPSIKSSLTPCPRERIILVYGRPNTPRNAFEILRAALVEWQQAEPAVAAGWQIISVGENFDRTMAPSIRNFIVAGKLSLEEYGKLLGKASVGISLMLSPHPSYPPLEMAYAGLRTITNGFTNKDLSRRNRNIISVPHITPGAVASCLAKTIVAAEADIGKITGTVEIDGLSSAVPIYDTEVFAKRLLRIAGASVSPETI